MEGRTVTSVGTDSKQMKDLFRSLAIALAMLFTLAAGAEGQQVPMGTGRIEPLPRDLEIQLALSALPSHLRDNATVHVLNPDRGFGYEWIPYLCCSNRR
jgi:hypothetical protein